MLLIKIVIDSICLPSSVLKFQAIEIDYTDVSVCYRLGCLAKKVGHYLLAMRAFTRVRGFKSLVFKEDNIQLNFLFFWTVEHGVESATLAIFG